MAKIILNTLNYPIIQEFLTRKEWITLTKDHKFIASVPAIFDLLQNPNAGDIVIALNAPKISWYKPNLKGSSCRSNL